MRRILLILVLLLGTFESVHSTGSGFNVIYHPDGALYVGDRVSMEVVPPPDLDIKELKVRLTVGEKMVGEKEFSPSGVGQREQATFWWVWDTRDLESGDQVLSYEILPDGPSWQENIQLLPAEQRPYSQASWVTTTTDCCMLAYITGTAAERDIELLKVMVVDQADHASELLHTNVREPINITFMPRLLGHGGFVSNGIYVTYMDGNIAGDTSNQVIHHEMVHSVDRSLGGKLLPAMLVEGLAVYLSGGHFKNEALLPRAAAVVDMESYIPLETLAENFYYQQHEIGYLEAGAFVEYVVGRFGWDAYQSFYRDIDDTGSQAGSMDSGLKKHFDISLDQLELDFLGELRTLSMTESVRNDLQITVEFYDSLRHYQKVLDPSAYFLTAWFPDGERMRQEGITADLLRTPDKIDNHFFEFLLRSASKEIEVGHLQRAHLILKVVNDLLSRYYD